MWRATKWPARPACFMSIHSVLNPSSWNSGEVHRPAILVHPPFEHRNGALLLGVDGLDHLLLCRQKRGRCGAGKGERECSQHDVTWCFHPSRLAAPSQGVIIVWHGALDEPTLRDHNERAGPWSQRLRSFGGSAR